MFKAPFPWFGGKSRVSHLVWDRFGNVPNYVEPFFGSGAVLLGRPHAPGIETANDKDGLLCNFWRSLAHDPEAILKACREPVHECDLHARHIALVGERETLTRKLEGDPRYYDVELAGWWIWGIAQWIGGGWCAGKGPWAISDGMLVKLSIIGEAGVKRQLPHLGSGGQGVKRQIDNLEAYIYGLSERMSSVRVTCGDWSRICGPTPTSNLGITGVFLDPPYTDESGKSKDTFYAMDSGSIGHDVAEWARANGNNKKLRIALCGYDGEHEMPESWSCVAWKATGGYGSQSDRGGRDNASRERIWFSPHCLNNLSLF